MVLSHVTLINQITWFLSVSSNRVADKAYHADDTAHICLGCFEEIPLEYLFSPFLYCPSGHLHVYP